MNQFMHEQSILYLSKFKRQRPADGERPVKGIRRVVSLGQRTLAQLRRSMGGRNRPDSQTQDPQTAHNLSRSRQRSEGSL